MFDYIFWLSLLLHWPIVASINEEIVKNVSDQLTKVSHVTHAIFGNELIEPSSS